MAKDQNIGAVAPDMLYSAEQLRQFCGGVSLRRMKDFIRENCIFTEPFPGCLFVLGSDFIVAMVELGTADSPEDKAERQRRAGVKSRKKEEALD